MHSKEDPGYNQLKEATEVLQAMYAKELGLDTAWQALMYLYG